MTPISPWNTALVLWVIVTTMLAILATPGAEWRFRMSDIMDAVMQMVRILFVVAWIGTVLALINISMQQFEKVSGSKQIPTSARGEVK